MKLFTSVLMILVLTFLFIALTGCTSAQVEQAANAGNQVIAATKDPLVQIGDEMPGIGPYIKLATDVTADVAYEFVRLINLFAPNAGEPTPAATQPTSQADRVASPAGQFVVSGNTDADHNTQ